MSSPTSLPQGLSPPFIGHCQLWLLFIILPPVGYGHPRNILMLVQAARGSLRVFFFNRLCSLGLRRRPTICPRSNTATERELSLVSGRQGLCSSPPGPWPSPAPVEPSPWPPGLRPQQPLDRGPPSLFPVCCP